MISRTLHDVIVASLKKHPVVSIIGSRQVGQTTLGKSVRETAASDAIYLDLELPSNLNKLQDPEL